MFLPSDYDEAHIYRLLRVGKNALDMPNHMRIDKPSEFARLMISRGFTGCRSQE
jgi:hypothetical protein